LGKDRDTVVAWLERRNLSGAPRLAELIEVEQDWDRAVESVLDTALEAIAVDRLEVLDAGLEELSEGRLTFIGPAVPEPAPPPQREALQPLAAVVRGAEALVPLLAGVYRAEDLTEARTLGHSLLPHERLVTRLGVQLGPGWLSLPDGGAAQNGVIRRERELQDLGQDLQRLQEQLRRHEREAAATQAELLAAEEQILDAQDQLAGAQDQRTQLQAQFSEVNARIEQSQERCRERAENIRDLSERIAGQRQALAR